MMIYEIRDELKRIEPEDVRPEVLTVGCVTCDEVMKYGSAWGFDEESVKASQKANPLFRTAVDVRPDYTFTQMKILNRDGHEDAVAIFIKKNFLLVVDIRDEDNSTINSFLKALRKYPCAKITAEKLLLWCIESLLSDGNTISEELRNRLTEMEETVINEKAGDRYNVKLMGIKKKILKYYDYYEQLRDISETLEENENGILAEDGLIYIANLTKRIVRLSDDMKMLINIADHLQDAYSTLLDQRMNRTMKIFTLITTIFFPLTIVVGWYGMNFKYMPELNWRYGYVYVIVLSVVLVALLYFIGKKKKWF